MSSLSKCTIVFEFRVGDGTDTERAARAQDCLTEVIAEAPAADRSRWAAGIPGPTAGQDVIAWINQSVLNVTSLSVRRTTIDSSPRYCVIWDGTNEIIVCYYDFELVYASGPKAGQRFEISHQGLFVPISLRFTIPMGWAVSPTTFQLLQV